MFDYFCAIRYSIDSQFVRTAIAMEPLNSALTPNSTFTQLTLNLLYESAPSAYIYIYRNTYYNFVFDSE